MAYNFKFFIKKISFLCIPGKNFIKKIALINSLIFLKLILTKKIQKNKIYCSSSSSEKKENINTPKINTNINTKIFDFLLKFNKEKFEKKNCPKIIYLNINKETNNKIIKENFKGNTVEKENLNTNFKKIQQNYPEFESYYIDIFKNYKNYSDLENLISNYGSSFEDIYPEIYDINFDNDNYNDMNSNNYSIDSNEEKKYQAIMKSIKNKPFLMFNKYGDLKAYTYKEFNEMAEGEIMMFNKFEKSSK